MKIIIILILLGGCATKPLTTAKVSSLSPEEVAQRGSEQDIFQKAKELISKNDKKGFFLLVNRIPNINAQNNVGDTLLHIVSDSKSPDLVKEVLKKKPLLNIQNRFDYTPLMYASFDSDLVSVKYLLDAGADPNVADGFNLNCLMRAAYHNDLAMVKLFMKYHTNPFGSDPKGPSASKLANWEEIKSLLVQYELNFK